MIELGTLVMSLDDGCVGIITWCDNPNNALDCSGKRIYKVAWSDNLRSLHYAEEFEVIA